MFVQTICWARQPAFRELDSGLCLSNFHVFLLAPPWEKQDMFGPEIFSFNLSSLDPPTVHLPGELRAQPWNRLRSVWNMGLLDENWAVEHLVMAIWCLHRFLTTFFQSSNLESKFETKPKPHISWPEMDIHRKHH